MIKGRPPLFAFRSRLKSVKQKNEKGTFYNFQIEPFNTNWKTSLIDPLANKNLLEEAKSFREMVTSGVARAAFETQDGEVSSETVVNATSEELPF